MGLRSPPSPSHPAVSPWPDWLGSPVQSRHPGGVGRSGLHLAHRLPCLSLWAAVWSWIGPRWAFGSGKLRPCPSDAPSRSPGQRCLYGVADGWAVAGAWLSGGRTTGRYAARISALWGHVLEPSLAGRSPGSGGGRRAAQRGWELGGKSAIVCGARGLGVRPLAVCPALRAPPRPGPAPALTFTTCSLGSRPQSASVELIAVQKAAAGLRSGGLAPQPQLQGRRR